MKTQFALAASVLAGTLSLSAQEPARTHGDAQVLTQGLSAAASSLQALGALDAARMSSLSGAALLAQELHFDSKSETREAAREDRDYAAGTRSLDASHWDEAVRHFDGVIDRKSSRADGAYYWKAYALNRSGRRSDALATLAELRRKFPQSRWLDDAQTLEVEIHAKEGRPEHPASESNEELKLIAINSLMQTDPRQALPILRKLLSSNQSPGLKDRALFVLSQSDSPEARQTLVDMARGKGDPDLQLKAVRYISMMGGDASRGELGKIYAATGDLNLKREIIRSYLLSGSKTELLAAAKGERNQDLRREAIRTLAQSGGAEEIWSLYKGETSPDVKMEIVHSMLFDGDSAHLLEIAKTEKDVGIRKAAIQTLALTGWGKDTGGLVEMYRNESDPAIKRELIQGMFLQQNAKGLIELARQEKNPEMKRQIVQQLSLIQSKDATEYMMEILK